MVAGISKMIFITLVLSQGRRYVSHLGPALVTDAVMVALFGWYLLAVRVAVPRR
jgi:hypothetical protein